MMPWLMYWTVYGLFHGLEMLSDSLIFWFPFYHEFKMIIILWLVLPQTQGSLIIYKYAAHPLLQSHEKDIDQALLNTVNTTRELSSTVGRRGLVWARRFILALFQKTNEFLYEYTQERESSISRTDSPVVSASETTLYNSVTVTPQPRPQATSFWYSKYLHAISSSKQDNVPPPAKIEEIDVAVQGHDDSDIMSPFQILENDTNVALAPEENMGSLSIVEHLEQERQDIHDKPSSFNSSHSSWISSLLSQRKKGPSKSL